MLTAGEPADHRNGSRHTVRRADAPILAAGCAGRRLEGPRPVKKLRLLGEELVLFRDPQGATGCWTGAARIAAPI